MEPVEEHRADQEDSSAELPQSEGTAIESSAGESRNDRFFSGVCSRLISLTEEGVFRQIVGYL